MLHWHTATWRRIRLISSKKRPINSCFQRTCKEISGQVITRGVLKHLIASIRVHVLHFYTLSLFADKYQVDLSTFPGRLIFHRHRRPIRWKLPEEIFILGLRNGCWKWVNCQERDYSPPPTFRIKSDSALRKRTVFRRGRRKKKWRGVVWKFFRKPNSEQQKKTRKKWRQKMENKQYKELFLPFSLIHLS